MQGWLSEMQKILLLSCARATCQQASPHPGLVHPESRRPKPPDRRVAWPREPRGARVDRELEGSGVVAGCIAGMFHNGK